MEGFESALLKEEWGNGGGGGKQQRQNMAASRMRRVSYSRGGSQGGAAFNRRSPSTISRTWSRRLRAFCSLSGNSSKLPTVAVAAKLNSTTSARHGTFSN